jgi:IS30 family transposase
MVAGADRRLAEAAVPNRSRHAALARNDLSEPVRSDAGRLEEGADGAFADQTTSAAGQGWRDQKRSGQIVDTVSIRERPADTEDRAVPGHWEGDLVCGANHSCMVTLVERASRSVMLLKVPGSETATVVGALTRHIGRLPAELRRSLTWDRGKEMAAHKAFTVATDVQVYFCDPRSPWQRGSNENTNGLLRQYFLKGTDLSRFSQSKGQFIGGSCISTCVTGIPLS